MRMVWRAALALSVAAALAGCGGGLPDPPAAYATYARDGLAFRHPPGWVAERAVRQPGTRASVVVRPRGANPDRPGPRIEARAGRLEAPLARLAERLRARLAGGVEELRLDVPGAEEAVAFEGADRRGARIATVVAARGAEVVVLSASAAEGDAALDPRAVAGSLRLR